MRTDRVEQRMRATRRRNVVVLCALSVIIVGILGKRLASPRRAVAQARTLGTQPAGVEARTLTVALAPEGWRPIATVERNPFGGRVEVSPLTLVTESARAFTVSGILRGRVSLATINGQRYREGETFGGVLLERIEADGVILVVDGLPMRVGIER